MISNTKQIQRFFTCENKIKIYRVEIINLIREKYKVKLNCSVMFLELFLFIDFDDV